MNDLPRSYTHAKVVSVNLSEVWLWSGEDSPRKYWIYIDSEHWPSCVSMVSQEVEPDATNEQPVFGE